MREWHVADAQAKLNLALVVGPRRPDGKHEVATVMERLWAKTATFFKSHLGDPK